MDFIENVKEAVKSIKDNLLRTSLTASIIAIGISSLVGILTAVDAIQSSVSSGLSDLGANSFDIRDVRYRSRRSQGQTANRKQPINFREIEKFQERFDEAERISIYGFVTSSAEVKYLSNKTNPNSIVAGIDEYYLDNKGYDLQKGREFSRMELLQGANVAVIGQDIVENLFKNVEPLDKTVSIRGLKYTVIGILDESGGLGSGRLDRSIFIPLLNANKYGARGRLSYTMTTTVKNPERLDYLIGQATGLMRTIRKDRLGQNNSFEISQSESAAKSIEETTDNLRLGGSLIGFITLIGAAIGLMNIMMVSVTERTREIGVRKALGATPSLIREQFLVEAVVICIIGGLVGIVFGMVLGNLVSLLFDDASFIFPIVWITIGLLVCIIVGVISGYYPASKASKLDPIESLRYE